MKYYTLEQVKEQIKKMYPDIVRMAISGFVDPSVGAYSPEIDGYEMFDSDGKEPLPASWVEAEIGDESDQSEYLVMEWLYKCDKIINHFYDTSLYVLTWAEQKPDKFIPNLIDAFERDGGRVEKSSSSNGLAVSYGDLLDGQVTLRLLFDQDDGILSDFYGVAFVSFTAAGEYEVVMDDIYGRNWGYILAGVGSIDVGAGVMRVRINNNSYTMREAERMFEGKITDSVKSVVFQAVYQPYGDKKIGGSPDDIVSNSRQYKDGSLAAIRKTLWFIHGVVV